MNPRFLAVTAVLILGAAACSSYKPAAAAKGNQERKAAPNFALADSQGKTLRLNDFKGKVVLLDFWATWCGPCRIEIPWFMEFQRRYKDKGFTVIGVSMDENGWEAVRPFVEEMKMNYPVVIGTDKTSSDFGGVEVLPTTFLIDKEGRIVITRLGLTSKDEFEKAIQDLL